MLKISKEEETYLKKRMDSKVEFRILEKSIKKRNIDTLINQAKNHNENHERKDEFYFWL